MRIGVLLLLLVSKKGFSFENLFFGGVRSEVVDEVDGLLIPPALLGPILLVDVALELLLILVVGNEEAMFFLKI